MTRDRSMDRMARILNLNLIAVFALALLAIGQSSAVMAQDTGLHRLTPDQKALASSMLTFMDQMDEKYFGRVEAFNGGGDTEVRTPSTEYTNYDLRVTRGPVVEKLGRMKSQGLKNQPGRGDGVLTWGYFYALDFHPKTPLVGMLHATIVMQFFEDGTETTGGFLGVLPGTHVDEDLDGLKQLMYAHFAADGKEDALPLYRQLLCKGTHETVEIHRRRPACSGASFYGPPIFRGDTERSYDFIERAFDMFVGAYVDTIEKRADEPFTDEDVAAQELMRKRWLIDQMFSDPFASKIVPFEVWSFQNMPPSVKF